MKLAHHLKTIFWDQSGVHEKIIKPKYKKALPNWVPSVYLAWKSWHSISLQLFALPLKKPGIEPRLEAPFLTANPLTTC